MKKNYWVVIILLCLCCITACNRHENIENKNADVNETANQITESESNDIEAVITPDNTLELQDSSFENQNETQTELSGESQAESSDESQTDISEEPDSDLQNKNTDSVSTLHFYENISATDLDRPLMINDLQGEGYQAEEKRLLKKEYIKNFETDKDGNTTINYDYLHKEYFYDLEGNIVREKEYNQDGTLRKQTDFDVDGNNIYELSFWASYYDDDKTTNYIEVSYTLTNDNRSQNYNLSYKFEDNNNGLLYDGYCIETETDEHNNIIGWTRFNSDGRVYRSVYYEYDYDQNGNVLCKREYENDRLYLTQKYDSHGNVIFEQFSYSCYEYMYSDDDKLLYSCNYDNDGSINYYFKNYYDENGNLSVQYFLWEQNENNDWAKYNELKNGPKNMRALDALWEADKSLFTYYEFEYDEYGNETKRIWHWPSGHNQTEESDSIYSYDFDEEGRVKREIKQYRGYNYQNINEYEYDEDGNLIKSTEVSKSQTGYTYFTETGYVYEKELVYSLH